MWLASLAGDLVGLVAERDELVQWAAFRAKNAHFHYLITKKPLLCRGRASAMDRAPATRG
jgi:hypothetical protein